MRKHVIVWRRIISIVFPVTNNAYVCFQNIFRSVEKVKASGVRVGFLVVPSLRVRPRFFDYLFFPISSRPQGIYLAVGTRLCGQKHTQEVIARTKSSATPKKVNNNKTRFPADGGGGGPITFRCWFVDTYGRVGRSPRTRIARFGACTPDDHHRVVRSSRRRRRAFARYPRFTGRRRSPTGAKRVRFLGVCRQRGTRDANATAHARLSYWKARVKIPGNRPSTTAIGHRVSPRAGTAVAAFAVVGP